MKTSPRMKDPSRWAGKSIGMNPNKHSDLPPEDISMT
jgi:hypothetical protein